MFDVFDETGECRLCKLTSDSDAVGDSRWSKYVSCGLGGTGCSFCNSSWSSMDSEDWCRLTRERQDAARDLTAVLMDWIEESTLTAGGHSPQRREERAESAG